MLRRRVAMMMDDGLIWVKIGCNTTLTVKDLRDGSVITVLAAPDGKQKHCCRWERQNRRISLYLSSSFVTIVASSCIPPATNQLPTDICLNLTLNVVFRQQEHLSTNLRPIFVGKIERNFNRTGRVEWSRLTNIRCSYVELYRICNAILQLNFVFWIRFCVEKFQYNLRAIFYISLLLSFYLSNSSTLSLTAENRICVETMRLLW